jgi:hypothetical protein
MTSENSIRDTQNNNEKEMFKTRGFENLIQKVNNVSKNIDAHINNIDMEDVSTNGESEMATIMRNQTSGQGASKTSRPPALQAHSSNSSHEMQTGTINNHQTSSTNKTHSQSSAQMVAA